MTIGVYIITVATFAVLLGYYAFLLWRKDRLLRDTIDYTARLKVDFDALYRERHNIARLVDIQRDARLTKFIFIRNGEFFTIETMGLLGDDVNEWKRQAGIFKQ